MSSSAEEKWIRIYSSSNLHEVLIVKGILEENNIESVEINKRDSAYTVFGEVELYIKENDQILADFIIRNKLKLN